MLSCTGENSNEGTLIELSSPEFNRQIIPLGSNEWRALIQVNSGPGQTFFFSGSTSPVAAVIDGVKRGQQNKILIKWFEILHGHTVEISVQDQDFFADGTTIISEPHTHNQFDYDGDGISNLDERSAGTCVWSAIESCINQGQIDIPTDNALLNGDFSNGIDYWVSKPPLTAAVTSGEFCVVSPATAVRRWDARMDYSPLTVFMDANSSYDLVFDVRAQTNSKVFVQITEKTLDNFESLVDGDTSVAVSTSYETKSIRYESGVNAHNEVLIGFTFGNGTDNTYCFDNIKLIREASQ